jgi:hypothetical protein
MSPRSHSLGGAFTPHASTALHCRSVDRVSGARVPAPVSRQWLSPRGASLSSCGVPVSPVPPLSAVLRRRYDFLSAYPWSLIWFASTAHGSPPRSCSPQRSQKLGGLSPEPGRLLVRPPQLPVSVYVDANRISQVSRRSFPCLCCLPRPRSNRRVLAITATSMLPPLPIQRRLRQLLFRGSLTQLQHLLTYASRFVLPLTRKARFRLAG